MSVVGTDGAVVTCASHLPSLEEALGPKSSTPAPAPPLAPAWGRGHSTLTRIAAPRAHVGGQQRPLVGDGIVVLH